MADITDLPRKGIGRKNPLRLVTDQESALNQKLEQPSLNSSELLRHSGELRESQRHIYRANSTIERRAHTSKPEPSLGISAPSSMRKLSRTENNSPQELRSHSGHETEKRLFEERAVGIARELFDAMKGGLTGIGTHERVIVLELLKLNPGDFKAVSQAYREQFNRDLKSDLVAELKDNQRFIKALKVLEHGDPIASRVAILELETSLPRTDHEVIMAILQHCSPHERSAIALRFREQTGQNLIDAIQENIPRPKAAEALALLSAEPGRLESALLRQLIERRFGVTAEAIVKLLCDITPGSLREIERCFREEAKMELSQALLKIVRGPDKEIVNAWLLGKAELAGALLLEKALGRGESFSQKIIPLLERIIGADREAFRRIFENRFGAHIESAIEGSRSLGGEMKHILGELVSRGSISEPSKIFLALCGDKDARLQIQSMLRSKSSEEITALLNAFRNQFGRELDAVIQSKLDRFERFDTRLWLLGAAEANEARYWNVWALHRFERERQLLFVQRALDSVSSHGLAFDKHVSELTSLYSERGKDYEYINKKGGPFSRLLSFAEGDVKTLRHATASFHSLLSLLVAVLCGALTTYMLSYIGLPLWQSCTAGLIAGYGTRRIAHYRLRFRGDDALDIIEDVKIKRRSLPPRRSGRTPIRTSPYRGGRK